MAKLGTRYKRVTARPTAPTSFTKGATSRKSIKKTLNNVAKAARKGADFTETFANEPFDAIISAATKAAGAMKTPIGSNGLTLMPSSAKERTISGMATGDVTTSATMYAYRPSRKRNREGEINYLQKATTTVQHTTAINLAKCTDLNILDAEPVLNNNASAPYSRLNIRKCFDEYLKAYVEDSSQAYTLKEQQTSVHVKTIASEVIIKNNSSTEALVDLYELVPQHSLGPSTYDTQTYAVGYMSPTWTYVNGIADTLQLEDTLYVNNVAARPNDSSLWTRTWKVLKKVRINMTGNSLHRHKSCIAVNKTVTYPEMAQFSTNGGKFAGWNPTYMIIQKGGPTGDATTGLTASTSDITLTCNMEMKYQASAQEQARVIVYDSSL
jgi:hypothetical protein